jgi:hypothetical protein
MVRRCSVAGAKWDGLEDGEGKVQKKGKKVCPSFVRTDL